MTRLFTDVLNDVARGQLVAALTEEYGELVDAIRNTGGKGEITIKLKISPNKGDTDVLIVDAERSIKAPRTPLRSSMFFPGEDGSLLRDDPRQRVMFSEAGANDPASDASRTRSRFAD